MCGTLNLKQQKNNKHHQINKVKDEGRWRREGRSHYLHHGGSSMKPKHTTINIRKKNKGKEK
jgi:hypothetical protein